MGQDHCAQGTEWTRKRKVGGQGIAGGQRHPEDEGTDQGSGCVDKLRRADVKQVYRQHPRSPHAGQKVAKIPAEPKKTGLHVRQQDHFLTQPSTALGLPSNHVHTASKVPGNTILKWNANTTATLPRLLLTHKSMNPSTI